MTSLYPQFKGMAQAVANQAPDSATVIMLVHVELEHSYRLDKSCSNMHTGLNFKPEAKVAFQNVERPQLTIHWILTLCIGCP